MAANKRARTEFQTNPEFVHTLISTKAESLVPPDGRIFIAERTHKVSDVWKGLIKHNFMSVPVLQKTKNKYYGFIDVADVVKFIVETFGAQKLSQDVNFFETLDKEELWRSRTVNDVMTNRISPRNPFHPVPKGYSLFTVFEMLAREQGVCRVPILSETSNLANLITDSQMIRYLNNNLKNIGSIKDKPISNFSVSHNEVLCISEDETAIKAFDLMITKKINGIAVIDANGKLVDNISLRDLKAIQSDGHMFHRLYQTIHNFLLKIRKEFAKKDDRPSRVVAIKNTDTLEHTIALCVDHGIHRVYIVDDQKKPTGVVTLHDMFAEILNSI